MELWEDKQFSASLSNSQHNGWKAQPDFHASLERVGWCLAMVRKGDHQRWLLLGGDTVCSAPDVEWKRHVLFIFLFNLFDLFWIQKLRNWRGGIERFYPYEAKTFLCERWHSTYCRAGAAVTFFIFAPRALETFWDGKGQRRNNPVLQAWAGLGQLQWQWCNDSLWQC